MHGASKNHIMLLSTKLEADLNELDIALEAQSTIKKYQSQIRPGGLACTGGRAVSAGHGAQAARANQAG